MAGPRPHALILGDELSGKTSLLTHLLLESAKLDWHPIVLDGTHVFKTRNFRAIVEQAHGDQILGDFGIWWSKRHRIALVDDFDHRVSGRFVQFLKASFEKVVLVGSVEDYFVYLKDDPTLADFDVVNIRPLGRPSQERLIRKWLSATDAADPLAVTDQQVDQIEEKVDSIISRYDIMPRYPFYVLTILQSLEAFMPADYHISAYGHCYQALVTAQLLRKNVRPDEIDTAFNFLAELAYKLFLAKESQATLDTASYAGFLSDYKANFIISDSLITRIENGEYPLLRKRPDSVDFEHPYVYYYFAGKHIAAEQDSELIQCLVDQCYRKDYAFLLIFTVHHAQDAQVIEEILLHCMCCFDTVPAARLDQTETDFMASLFDEMPKSILSALPVEREREEERSELPPESAEEESPANLVLQDVEKALKIMDVLGQILKNRSGSFAKPRVIEVLEATQDVGLRVLNFFLSDLRSEELRRWLIRRLEIEEQRRIRENEVIGNTIRREIIEKNLQFLAFALTLGVIRRIASCISTDKIIDVNNDLSQEKATPAYALINTLLRLRHCPIDIPRIRKLRESFDTEKNRWAGQTLSIYLQNYLNTHRIEQRVRQQMCSLLGIKYFPNRG